VEEQRRLGGKPEVCSVFKYEYYLFEKDDRALDELADRCRRGEVLCGECKQLLIQRINAFLEEHQRKREEAKERSTSTCSRAPPDRHRSGGLGAWGRLGDRGAPGVRGGALPDRTAEGAGRPFPLRPQRRVRPQGAPQGRPVHTAHRAVRDPEPPEADPDRADEGRAARAEGERAHCQGPGCVPWNPGGGHQGSYGQWVLLGSQ